MNHYEDDMHFVFYQEAKLKYPWAEYLYKIEHGGKRPLKTAVRLKKSGVKKGIFDFLLKISAGKYSCLWIEFKYGKNKLTTDQETFMRQCIECGEKCIVCYSIDEAFTEIDKYLKKTK